MTSSSAATHPPKQETRHVLSQPFPTTAEGKLVISEDKEEEEDEGEEGGRREVDSHCC